MVPVRVPTNDQILPSPSSDVEDKLKDGLNFYRSISRWEYGNPDRYEEIKDLLLQYLTVHTCSEHPLHDRFCALQQTFNQKQQLCEDSADAKWRRMYMPSAFALLGMRWTPRKAAAHEDETCLTWALGYPDVFPSSELYEVIAILLSIRLDITYNSVTTTFGPEDCAPYRITVHEPEEAEVADLESQDRKPLTHFSSIPAIDKQGSDLLSFLHDTRQNPPQNLSGVDVRRAEWRWRNYIQDPNSTDYKSITCVDNEYRIKKREEDPPEDPSTTSPPLDHSFQVFAVCVSKPEQVKPAVDYMLECLAKAPCQGLPGLFDVNGRGKKTLKPFIGVDAEFVKRAVRRKAKAKPKDDENDNGTAVESADGSTNEHAGQKVGQNADETANESCLTGHENADEKVEQDAEETADKSRLSTPENVDAVLEQNAEDIADESCFREYMSVLSFAIDRHVVFMFYVLDMLENANDETVTALHYLYQKTIFDSNILKVWHNYQSDILVVESNHPPHAWGDSTSINA